MSWRNQLRTVRASETPARVETGAAPVYSRLDPAGLRKLASLACSPNWQTNLPACRAAPPEIEQHRRRSDSAWWGRRAWPILLAACIRPRTLGGRTDQARRGINVSNLALGWNAS